MGVSCNRCGARWRGERDEDWHREPQPGEKSCQELFQEIVRADDRMTELRERFVTFAEAAACIPQSNRSHEQQVLGSFARNLSFRPDNVNLSMFLLYIRAGEGVQRNLRGLVEEMKAAQKVLDRAREVDLGMS